MAENFAKKPIIAITGPTASGKTALAVECALKFSAEIVNFDSVQVYREIEIATAKPSQEERRGVPHHLIDFVDPRRHYSAADWAADAERAISEIDSRSKQIILVGGTGFYLRALLRPFSPAPSGNLRLRQILREIANKESNSAVNGSGYLHKMLSQLDKEAAGRISVSDLPRIIRALEVIFITGRRFSALRDGLPSASEFSDRVKLFVLNPPRSELYQKINARSEAHFKAGLVEEVSLLLEKGLPAESSALGAHAYRRVVEYLQGKRTLESAIEKSKQDVRNYAKRQLTWFRRENVAKWLNGFGDDRLIFNEAYKEIEKLLSPTPLKLS